MSDPTSPLGDGVQEDTDASLALTENARTVLAKRYLRRNAAGEPIETPEELFRRVATNIAEAELRFASGPTAAQAVEHWAAAFLDMMTRLEFLPNSPTLMNAGRTLQQLSACFVLPVEDSMAGIFETLKQAAIIHKSGGGTGFSFSRLRPRNDVVASTSGIASGPVSFMSVYDSATEHVKQGGARRGANMGILRVDHPDILEFIECKEHGDDLITNFNISVAVDEAFMAKVLADEEYDLVNPRTGMPQERLRARDVFERMVRAAWRSGDPGIVFIDRMNEPRTNPTPAVGMIEATNPCVVGSTRIATSAGLLRMDELEASGRLVGAVVREERLVAGGDAVAEAVLYPMSRVFETGENVPVVRVRTSHGYEVTCTPGHHFITPRGKIAAQDLQEGETLFLQPGEGCWGDERLPAAARMDHLLADAHPNAAGRIRGKVARGVHVPDAWSAELGETLGWAIGDGYVSGNRLYLYVSDDEAEIMPVLRERMRAWFGAEGAQARRHHVTQLSYPGLPCRFFRALGMVDGRAPTKRVPEAVFTAPREAVVGFLRGLFTTDGTVNVSMQHHTCSVRLASSSRGLLVDVQELLLNLGMVSRIHLRRRAGTKLLPGPDRQPKEYKVAAQYELILDGADRDRFAAEVGFLTEAKQRKVAGFVASMRRGSRPRWFETRAVALDDAGRADVYNVTQFGSAKVTYSGVTSGNCGEQPLLSHESCNLGSVNLAQLCDDSGHLDWDRLREVVHTAVRFLDDVVEVNHYPTPEIERMTREGNRKVGLGVMGWADLLVRAGIPYDSQEAVDLGGEVMAFIETEADAASEALAGERGCFPNWPGSYYEEIDRPMRNATRTTIAPTGTISIIAGCSSGIEPLFALAYHRKVLDGATLREMHPDFERVARERGCDGDDVLEAVAGHGCVRGVPGVPDDVQRVFATAHDISSEWHVRMQAAFQRHTDNAVSKTVNLPHDATPADVERVYLLAHELGCKGVTVYRDRSKETQVLNLGLPEPAETTAVALTPAAGAAPQAGAAPVGLAFGEVRPRPVPDDAAGLVARRFKVRTPLGTMNVFVTELDHRPFEVFVVFGKAGSDLTAMSEAVGRLISLALRSGIPVELVIEQLRGIGGRTSIGFGEQRVLSVVDALAKVLERNYGDVRSSGGGGGPSGRLTLMEICPECQEYSFEIAEGCGKCHFCGYSTC